jgi:hypothetical protein
MRIVNGGKKPKRSIYLIYPSCPILTVQGSVQMIICLPSIPIGCKKINQPINPMDQIQWCVERHDTRIVSKSMRSWPLEASVTYLTNLREPMLYIP